MINKKLLKKLVAFLLILNLFLFNNISNNHSFAINVNSSKSISIKTGIINDETEKYAKSVYQKHLLALIDSGGINSDFSEFLLGNAFEVYNVYSNKYSSCFPIVYNSSIVAILEVYKDNNEYSSSLSKSFSVELENLLINNIPNLDDFFLLTDGINLQAYDGNKSVEIYELYRNENSEDFGKIFTISSQIVNNVDLMKLKEPLEVSDAFGNIFMILDVMKPNAEIKPYVGKTINVKGVSQGNHPWCWAATTAAMINYYKGNALSASDVARYVFPKNPVQKGAWTDMKKAYNHWGLYPTQTGVIGFNSVMYNINKNKPMHLGLKGHSVGLIGYQKWIDYYGGDRVLILLEPQGAVRKSVTINSNNNFYYELGGSNAWVYTREF